VWQAPRETTDLCALHVLKGAKAHERRLPAAAGGLGIVASRNLLPQRKLRAELPALAGKLRTRRPSFAPRAQVCGTAFSARALCACTSRFGGRCMGVGPKALEERRNSQRGLVALPNRSRRTPPRKTHTAEEMANGEVGSQKPYGRYCGGPGTLNEQPISRRATRRRRQRRRASNDTESSEGPTGH